MKKKLKDGYIIFFGLAICMNIVNIVGFVEATAIFALFVTMLMNPQKHAQNVFCALIIGVAVWAMKMGFGFILPMGPLGI